MVDITGSGTVLVGRLLTLSRWNRQSRGMVRASWKMQKEGPVIRYMRTFVGAEVSFAIRWRKESEVFR